MANLPTQTGIFSALSSRFWTIGRHHLPISPSPHLLAFLILLISPNLPAAAKDIELKVGVVQRFGSETNEQLTLQATEGDRLTLKFLGGDQKPQSLQLPSVQLEVTMQPLKEPYLSERVVLGNYRSFETAEDSAKQWQAQGVAVEIVQAERWQVWAKRDVYSTPLLRRLLLQNLQAKGAAARLESQVLAKKPQVTWKVGGFRYSRQELDIAAGKNIVEVKQGKVGAKEQTARLYAGKLRVQPNASGSYTLVNQVPLETYLRGVVPHEIGPGAPYAAVEAQAIIARTYALRNLRRFAADGYELCADTHCQVYRGLRGTVETADRAIAATQGQVLAYQNELVDALYSAATGGITSPFNDIWNGENRPYLKAVVDAASNVWDLTQKPLGNEENLRGFLAIKNGFNEEGWNIFRWRRESTLEEIGEFLQRYLQRTNSPGGNFSKILQVAVTERSPFGRALKVTVETDTGKIELLKDDIRSAFLAPRSTLFYLEPVYNADKTLKGYAFVGGGMGHGVGLSQMGAYRLAKLGWSSAKILSFYYPGTQIQTLSDKIIFWSEK